MEKTEVTVSVIIPNMNGKKYLADCLGSLRSQDYQNFEVIVVDNGSCDGSEEFIERSFPEARVVFFKRPLGFSRAVNAGIRESRGRYIALLNNDTSLSPGWLGELIRTIESESAAGFCASRILRREEAQVIDSAGDGLGVNGLGYNIGSGENNNGGFNRRKEVFGACAAAALYRRSMLEDIGLFDEDFHSIFEDTDISFRAQLKAYKCLYAPEAVVRHRRFGTIGVLSRFAVCYSASNSLNLIVKNMPFRLILRYFPQIILGQYVKSVELLSGPGYGLALLKGRLKAIFQLRKMLAKRKDIQASRRIAASLLEQRLSVSRKRDLLPLVAGCLSRGSFKKILFGVFSAIETSLILGITLYYDALNVILISVLRRHFGLGRLWLGISLFYKVGVCLAVASVTLIFMAIVLAGIVLNDILQYIFRSKGVFKEALPKKDYQKGLLSLVILNWNGRHFLERLFNSLTSQTLSDFEIILVDNGSIDGSQEFVSRNYPGVRIIENKVNLGFARGTNTGIRQARGEYVAVLNNDTYLDSHWSAEVLRGLRENTDIGIFGSKIYLDGLEKTFDIAAQGFGRNGRTVNIGAGSPDSGQFDALRQVFGVSACAAIYRRSVLEDIGLFDEDFFNSYEDNDLHFRANILGHRCMFLKDAIVYHKGTATIGVGTAFHIYHLCKNSAHPMIKNMRLEDVLRNFFRIAVGPVAEFVFFALRWNQPGAVLSGIFRALGDLPLMLSKRRHLIFCRRFI